MFLGLLVLVVLLCTLLEAWVIFYNNNLAAPATPSLSSIEDTGVGYGHGTGEKGGQVVYDNAAYVPDSAGNGQWGVCVWGRGGERRVGKEC